MTSSTILKEITSPVSEHLEQFEGYMRDQMRSKTALLDTVVRYMMRQRGKRVRPMLVFLSAGLCGRIDNRAYVGASMVELLHTATLVHDDVVDEASERRGMASINAVWKNKVSVLVGDYLLSRGLLIAVRTNEFDFLRVTSDAVRRMSEGELLQIQKSRQRNIDEETYFRIISDKTASLISACCEIGAISATHDTDVQLIMRQYGECVGLAFQIRDDVLDYTSRSAILGKPVASDLKDQKITLPLIYACAAAPRDEARSMISLVKRKVPQRKEIDVIMGFVEKYKGIEASQDKASALVADAVRLIQQLPESAYKNSLIDFANFAVTRTA